MSINSNFHNDLKDSADLSCVLDRFYTFLFSGINTKSELDLKRSPSDNLDKEMHGIDLELTINRNNENTIKKYFDEKSTLDYKRIDSPLSTFAFELGSLINGNLSEGWLTNKNKYTQYYILVWPHMNENNIFDAMEIMFIERKSIFKIINRESKGKFFEIFTPDKIKNIIMHNYHTDFKYHKKYNYYYYENPQIPSTLKVVHSIKKAERPLNIVLKKELLYPEAKGIYTIAYDEVSQHYYSHNICNQNYKHKSFHDMKQEILISRKK